MYLCIIYRKILHIRSNVQFFQNNKLFTSIFDLFFLLCLGKSSVNVKKHFFNGANCPFNLAFLWLEVAHKLEKVSLFECDLVNLESLTIGSFRWLSTHLSADPRGSFGCNYPVSFHLVK